MDRCTSLFQSRIHGQNRQWGASSSCIHHTLAEINLGHAVEIDFTPLDGTLPSDIGRWTKPQRIFSSRSFPNAMKKDRSSSPPTNRTAHGEKSLVTQCWQRPYWTDSCIIPSRSTSRGRATASRKRRKRARSEEH